MVTKKEILNAPYVKKAFFDGHLDIFDGPVNNVIANLEAYSADKLNLRIEICYGDGYSFPKFTWDVPMTIPEVETERYRRQKLIEEMDFRRNRKKRVAAVKAAKSTEEVLKLLSEDPDLLIKLKNML